MDRLVWLELGATVVTELFIPAVADYCRDSLTGARTRDAW